jgi:hypothetical protein
VAGGWALPPGKRPKWLAAEKGMKRFDLRKLALAELLWKRTAVTHEWIAEKPSMRSAANVSQQLRRFDRVKTQSRLPPEIRTFLSAAWSSAMRRFGLSRFAHGPHFPHQRSPIPGRPFLILGFGDFHLALCHLRETLNPL